MPFFYGQDLNSLTETDVKTYFFRNEKGLASYFPWSLANQQISHFIQPKKNKYPQLNKPLFALGALMRKLEFENQSTYTNLKEISVFFSSI